jgi:zinc protease
MNDIHRTQPASASARSNVRRVVSTRGIEAWLVEEHAVPVIALEFAFTSGAADEPAEKSGVTGLLSDLLTEGAGPYDSVAFHQRLDDLAIELSFSGRLDSFAGSLRTLARNRDAAFEMLGLALNEAHIASDAVERVRAQAIAGLKHEAKDPGAVSAKSWFATAFGAHGYARPADGDLATVAAIAREDVLARRAALFRRDRLKIAVVGAIDEATLAAKLDELFGAMPLLGEAPALAAPGFSGLGDTRIVDIDVPQCTIRFGSPGFKRDDPDFIAAAVGNHILGGGSFTSRLWQEVRESRGLAYSVQSWLQPLRQFGLFMAYTATSNARAHEAVAIIKGEVARFAAEGPSEDELTKAKQYLMGSYALRFDTSSKIAGELLTIQLFGQPIDFPQRYPALVGALGLADVKRASERLLGAGEMLTVIAGRPDKA